MIFVKQKDTMDCGPSCLAMVSIHYGRKVDCNLLRQKCALGKDGVSLLGISKAAEFMGLKTIGGRLSFEVLAKNAPANGSFFYCLFFGNNPASNIG